MVSHVHDTAQSACRRIIYVNERPQEVKARSKPMRNIMQRLLAHNDFDSVLFGDKVILDEGRR